MSEQSEKKQSRWQEMASREVGQQEAEPATLFPQNTSIPSELTVRLSHGVWFGIAVGIGFSIGFLISFLALLGFIGFVVYSRFPGLFS